MTRQQADRAQAAATHPAAARPYSVLFENLENRTLFSTIQATDYGAVPNDGNDDRAAIQAAIHAAKKGDTIVFADGTYDIAGQINLKSGITITAANPVQAVLNFTVATSGDGSFAMLGGGLENFTMVGMDVRSNNGIFLISSTVNCTFTDNYLQWGYNGSYYKRLAFLSDGVNENLTIERNYFHDSPDSDRNVELWGLDNSSYSYNRFYIVNDGGHIMDPLDNVKFSYNTGRMIHRMGIEIQQDAYMPDHVTQNLMVEGNVFYDWNHPYWDSMGMSVPIYGNNTTIINNYIRQNAVNGAWGEADGSGNVRGSYGIEAPSGTSTITGNIIGGERTVVDVSTPGKNTTVSGNTFYGAATWGRVLPEPGPEGSGSVAAADNKILVDLSKMPDPPTKRRSGGSDSEDQANAKKKKATAKAMAFRSSGTSAAGAVFSTVAITSAPLASDLTDV